MLRLIVQSAWCLLSMLLRGIRPGRVSCVGSPPVFYGRGTVRIGQVAFRGVIARSEIGAVDGGILEIGDRVFVNQGATIVATTEIRIGSDCRIGDNVAIYDSAFHPVEQGASTRRAPVRIAENVWLARDVVVLPGSTIGAHAVVSVGTVVRGEVPDRVVISGDPWRVVRGVHADEGWRRA